MEPKLIDIHAHIQFNAFRNDVDLVIKRATDAGVLMVAPSSQLSTSERSIEYAKKYPGKIFAAVGLHPIHLKPTYFDPSEEAPRPEGGRGSPTEWAAAFHTRVEEFSYETYKKLAQNSCVVAIGETGLDYAERLEVDEDNRKKQEALFRAHIELALEVGPSTSLGTGKPIIQHCRSGVVGGVKRNAHDDTLRIVSDYVSRGLKGVAHCYSGNLEQAKRYVELGFYISFTGLITYVNDWDKVIREIPLDRIMVETDCPYMTPVPHRGERNEPVYVRYVAERLAEIKGISSAEVAGQTTKNAKNLFKINL